MRNPRNYLPGRPGYYVLRYFLRHPGLIVQRFRQKLAHKIFAISVESTTLRLKVSNFRLTLIIRYYEKRLRIKGWYLRLANRPDLILVFCVLLAFILALGVPPLAIIYGEAFWRLFEHITAALALFALLLALPALAYAVSTERGVRDISRVTSARLTHLASATAVAEVRDASALVADTISSLASLEGSPEEVLRRFALDSAIEAGAGVKAVVRLFERAELFVLGEPAEEGSDILHFTADDSHGEEETLLPVFTRWGPLENSIRSNQEWQKYTVLAVNGGALLESRDAGVTLVINPWSPPGGGFRMP